MITGRVFEKRIFVYDIKFYCHFFQRTNVTCVAMNFVFETHDPSEKFKFCIL